MVVADNGFRVAAYDVFAGIGAGIAGTPEETARRADGLTHNESFLLLLNGDTFNEIRLLWDKLADGATVIAPLSIAPLSIAQSAAPAHGMLTDRFDVTWIFGVTPN